MRSDTYTLRNLFRRLERRPDPWRGLGRRGQGLAVARARLAKMAEGD